MVVKIRERGYEAKIHQLYCSQLSSESCAILIFSSTTESQYCCLYGAGRDAGKSITRVIGRGGPFNFMHFLHSEVMLCGGSGLVEKLHSIAGGIDPVLVFFPTKTNENIYLQWLIKRQTTILKTSSKFSFKHLQGTYELYVLEGVENMCMFS